MSARQSAIDTLCLVDDDPIYRYVTQAYLNSRQLARRILSFADGELALFYLQKHLDSISELPDMILLDLNMPIMDGWEFLEEFIQLKPNIGKPVTVFIVSSSVDERDIERARRISAVSDYIVKPIDDTSYERILSRI